MKAVFALTPAESRRLIARGVAQMNEVKAALERAYVIIVGGTTNGFVAQEIAGLEVDPQGFTAGTSTKGVLCVTRAEERDERIPVILYKGERVDKTVGDAFEDFHLETVVIKGANAVDPDGNVGVITSGFDGGTVAATIGTMTSTGMKYIFPVGLEKLVPSVPEAARWAGSKTFDYSIGAPFGMFCLSDGIVFTEIEALDTLAGVEAKHIASGGIGGSQGAVIIAAKGDEASIKKAIEAVEAVKGEPPVEARKGRCEDCPYPSCAYHGMAEEDLPAWLQTA
ncbi:MAG: hypothetical protein QGI83_05880 [Candidatus Latescibacteria bacterium]|jgi:hypothetical protein|nr:hypothetical protein [Candidatus Latescibacterota bacterium]